MATLQRDTSRLNYKRLGATVATGALALGSLAVVNTNATATELSTASASFGIGTGFPTATEIATLLTNQVDPVVVDSETTELEFADAVINDSYTETGPVTEELGDQQQIDAVEQALQEQTKEIAAQDDSLSDTQGIARIDLEADVAVVGVTWDLDAPQPESVYWRYLTDGMWTEWGTIEPEVNDSVEETRGGTEPLTLANVQAVEVIAKTETGVDVSGLTLHVINAESFAPAENVLLDIYPEQIDEDVAQSGEQAVEEDESAGEEQPTNPAETGQGDKVLDTDGLVETDGVSLASSVAETMFGIAPMAGLNAEGTIYDTGFEGLKIGTRKAWCTGDCKQVSIWTPEPITIKGAVVHHTEGNNDYTQAQVPQQLRNVYQWQAVSRGWGDIGYNLVVDKYGGVWEGRYGGLTKAIQGAHAYGANYDTFGITVLGSYTSAAPPTVARQAMTKAIAWKLNLHGVKSATANITIRSQWGTATVPTVSAHRDVGYTDCPGDAFYKQMTTVRSEVNTYLAKLNSTGTTTPAPSASAFNPGNVISDAVFYNPNAMTEAQIKAFIESVGSSCTSSGSSKCLKDMTFSTAKLNPIRVKSGGCSALNLTGNQRPWTIIDKAAKACGLNPQVILVTIQKEQSGLTQPKTDAVWAKAMGAGCPDNSGCDAAQAGFTKQIYYGAEKLATYKINATWEQYILAFQNGQSVTVQNNAGTACGSQTFRLQNYATASLYMYTPYVGNSSSSSCATIGQKMFWDLMQRYFPSSLGDLVGVSTTRLAGADRYETSAAISKASFPNASKGTVYVATSYEFPDSLAAAPAAAKESAPLLLVPATGVLPASIKAELARLKPSKIVVVGGTGAVSAAMQTNVKNAAATNPTVVRIGGSDRYETAAKVAEYAFKGTGGTVFLATGRDFPDALSASAAAGYLGVPVLLTDGNQSSLGPNAAASLKILRPTKVYIVGASGAVSSGVEAQVKTTGAQVVRLGGADRYETSSAIMKSVFNMNSTTPAVPVHFWTTGLDFPDALSGAAAAGAAKVPLYVVRQTCVPSQVLTDLRTKGTSNVKLLGGAGVLTAAVASFKGC